MGSSDKSVARFFPLNIKVESVLGLLNALYNTFNKHADIFALANHFDLDADDLLPLLSVIELLGFSLIQGGDVILTPQGEKFLNASSNLKRQILREKIKEIEPFKTSISLLKEVKEAKIEDIAEELRKLGYPEVNEFAFLEKLTNTLMEWGVYTGIMRYSSESRSFKLNEKVFKS
ncbi:MAG TPA: AAA-associated domain-containing protein [Geobacterales bacterium]|nr:AAA-associated domain-containing protein [Geobacterales bacterium]